MRTVIFATKSHIDWINRYRLFFEPFLTSDVHFCEWDPDGTDIENAVPGIYDCIGGERIWKAIILYDNEEARNRLNPFDAVEEEVCTESEEMVLNSDEESVSGSFDRYKKGLQEKVACKKQAYDQAAKQPLTRLVTFLCDAPLDASAEYAEPGKELSGEPETEEFEKEMLLQKLLEQKQFISVKSYKETAAYKRGLREKILNGEHLRANFPEEVYCISLRTIRDQWQNDEQKNTLAWNTGINSQYSDFNDRNLYFGRMRYLVFDILPDTHVNYKFSYLEFVYTLLVFAANKVPTEAFRSGRVYTLLDSVNEDRLKQLVAAYDQKLENTVGFINKRITEIEGEIPGPMTDEKAEKVFQTRQTIQVLMNPNLDLDGYYVKTNVFGLATDCPADERSVWRSMHTKSRDAMHKLMKQPRRSLEKAVEEFRQHNRVYSMDALGLNHFQLDDIRQFAEEEEDKMVSVPTKDFYDIERYEKEMEERSDDVVNMIDTRMKKRTTVVLGAVALFFFFIGFIPVIFYNRDFSDVPVPTIMALISLALMALIGVVVLVYFRKKLKDRAIGYNMTMGGIKSDVDLSMKLFSDYLSHACRVMRGNDVLEECSKKDNVFKQKIRVLRRHIEQIRDKQSELRDLFGEYVSEHTEPEASGYYVYNFEKAKEYEYPVPFMENGVKTISFISGENKIEIPFAVIDKIAIRMEELYE